VELLCFSLKLVAMLRGISLNKFRDCEFPFILPFVASLAFELTKHEDQAVLLRLLRMDGNSSLNIMETM
jgi:hypothetical protein